MAKMKKNDVNTNDDNKVYQLRDGWYCQVNDRQYGPWSLKGYALAGYATEVRRAVSRAKLPEVSLTN